MKMGGDLIRAVVSKDLVSVSEGVLDAAIDQALKDGFLKDLPGVEPCTVSTRRRGWPSAVAKSAAATRGTA